MKPERYARLDKRVMNDARLTFCAKGVYAVLSTCVDEGSCTCTISMPEIAELAGISPRQVMRMIKVLERYGHITITRNKDVRGAVTAHTYTLTHTML